MHGQGGSLLFEENPATTTDYLYLLDKPFGKVEDGEVYYYATDHLGTVTAITDAAGQAVWKDDATPFGENTGQSGPGRMPYALPVRAMMPRPGCGISMPDGMTGPPDGLSQKIRRRMG